MIFYYKLCLQKNNFFTTAAAGG